MVQIDLSALRADRPELPKYLYKFRSLANEARQNNWNALTQHYTWIASPLTFNDPYDCTFRIDADAQVLDAIELDATSAMALSKSVEEEEDKLVGRAIRGEVFDFQKELATTIGPRREQLRRWTESEWGRFRVVVAELLLTRLHVGCFNAHFGSPLMWAHYAENHSGYCIEYEVATLPEEVRENLLRVQYSKDRANLSEQAILVKAEDWKYEQEWRVVLPGEGPGQELAMSKPRRLLLGTKIRDMDRVALVDFARTSGIPAVPMELSPTLYEMIPSEQDLTLTAP